MQNNNREFNQVKEIVLEKRGASSAKVEILAAHLAALSARLLLFAYWPKNDA